MIIFIHLSVKINYFILIIIIILTHNYFFEHAWWELIEHKT